MALRQYRIGSAFVSFFLLVAACSDRSDSTGLPTEHIPTSLNGFALSRLLPNQNQQPLGESWRVLAVEHPGFAGLWRDETGGLVLSATSAFPPASMRAAARQWLITNGRLDLADQTAKVKLVSYDYAQLSELKFRIARMTVAEGLQGIGVDEVSGKVFLSTDASHSESIRRMLSGAGISDDAFRMEIEPKPENTSCANLQAACTPLNAGLQVVDVAGNAYCSIGMLGWRNDSLQPGQPDFNYKVLVTASHCTNGQTTVAGDTLYQPTFPGTAIAMEVDEAVVYPSLTCQAWGYVYTACRHADAAVFKVFPSISMSGGSVAVSNTSSPPSWLSQTAYTGGGPIGTVVGDSVIRVGSVNGQKKGRISMSCVDRSDGFITNLFTLCTQRVTGTPVLGGDSGGLVYVPYKVGDSRTPRSAGIVIQTDFAGGLYFSPTGSVLASVGYQYFLVW